MKYLVRLIGVVIIWPFFILCNIWAGIIYYFFCSIWHLKIMFKLPKVSDFYFPMFENWEIELEGNIPNAKSILVKYKTYYKTPKDMLLNRITKESI